MVPTMFRVRRGAAEHGETEPPTWCCLVVWPIMLIPPGRSTPAKGSFVVGDDSSSCFFRNLLGIPVKQCLWFIPTVWLDWFD
ncbi:hypothetical protein Isop_0938 [Isosphaera pallida ATCC 43644]|uniref:Uncharacterized protein n=1 Tax=Isosphaera pallida (strain ATCC 43644 / DSM 9630 / IS1B) TaxID=575540 RepID=E8R323_ISOPI|nr:hypothetical protein Isop_0938 [Isosphaera pallida ATCC 43644]